MFVDGVDSDALKYGADGLLYGSGPLQLSGDNTVSIVKRDNVAGVVTDLVVNQSDWNLDKLDGTTQSGIGLTFTATQLFATDFQWLGVGRIRCGFVVGGSLIYCHDFNHSNVEENVYWSHPSLPIRCEVRNTDTAVGITSMQQICSTVLSEGGYEESGIEFAVGSTSPVLIEGFANAPDHRKCIAAIISSTLRLMRSSLLEISSSLAAMMASRLAIWAFRASMLSTELMPFRIRNHG